MTAERGRAENSRFVCCFYKHLRRLFVIFDFSALPKLTLAEALRRKIYRINFKKKIDKGRFLGYNNM